MPVLRRRRASIPRRTPPRATETESPDPSCPLDTTDSDLPTGKVIFTDAKDETMTVEIAVSDADQERGLMGRGSMPADHGMIFVFQEAQNQRFWMHDTCIPLDMIFIDDATIVGLEENCRTMDDSVYEVGCPSNYVVEANQGYAREHGIKAGQRVSFEGIP